jgi:hypothetical protein
MELLGGGGRGETAAECFVNEEVMDCIPTDNVIFLWVAYPERNRFGIHVVIELSYP